MLLKQDLTNFETKIDNFWPLVYYHFYKSGNNYVFCCERKKILLDTPVLDRCVRDKTKSERTSCKKNRNETTFQRKCQQWNKKLMSKIQNTGSKSGELVITRPVKNRYQN